MALETRGPRLSAASEEDLLGFLLGDWALERRLVDERQGLEGSFEGVARFLPGAAGAAAYREDGTMRWQAHVGPAFRALACAARGPASVDFAFPDGRHFHRLELRRGGYDALHLCGEDRYAGHFVLVGADAWRATWHVEGPAKALVIDGTYRRVTTPRA